MRASLATVGAGSHRERRVLFALLLFVVSSLISTTDGAVAARTQKRCRARSETNPDDLLILVNKDPRTRLSRKYEPSDLRNIPDSMMMPGRSGKLRSRALRALRELRRAAKKDGLDIRVRSAYRSFHTQEHVFAAKTREFGPRKAARVSARPGHSQHQLGTTIDFVSKSGKWKLTSAFAHKKEGRWLRANAHLFGFVMSYPRGERGRTGYSYEPWHYRYVGERAAKEIHRKGVLLEDYLHRCGKCQKGYRCERKK